MTILTIAALKLRSPASKYRPPEPGRVTPARHPGNHFRVPIIHIRVYTSLREFYRLATAAVRFTAAALTDRGRKRPSNEDAFGFSVEDGVYVLCDGMGGAAAGEVASSIAVDEVLRIFHERNGSAVLPHDAEEAIGIANEAIYSRAPRIYKLRGRGPPV